MELVMDIFVADVVLFSPTVLNLPHIGSTALY